MAATPNAPACAGTTRRRRSRPTTSACATPTALFVDGEFADPRSGAPRRRSTPRPRSRWPRSPSPAPRTSRARSKTARAAQASGPRCPALERGKYLFRIARLIQERARELAVVETMDGGKPIRESRDIDIPLAAAHFFHYAGWADKLSYGLAGRDPRRSASSPRSCRGTSRC